MTASFTVKLKDSRRRVYITKEVWEYLKLHPGDFIKIDIEKLVQDKK